MTRPSDGPQPPRPPRSVIDLWRRSCAEFPEGSDEQHARYRTLLREHGHLVDRQPGDDPNLPCGWPGTAS